MFAPLPSLTPSTFLGVLLLAAGAAAVVPPSAGCQGIQAAIRALPASGGVVTLASGTYVCTTAIVIDRNNVTLRGEGPSTSLVLAGGANSPVIVIGSTQTPPPGRGSIRVIDLSIHGNRLNQSWECWGGPCDQGGLSAIRNSGIAIRGANDVRVERVQVRMARSGGLVTERGCRRVTVRDLTSVYNHFDGLAAYQTEDSLFSGLHLYGNLAAGLSFDSSFDHNVVSDATIAASGTVGIFMRDSHHNVFESIQIRDSGEHGVFLATPPPPMPARPAVGNAFHGLVVAGSTQHGFRVNDADCTDNLLCGAQLVGNGGDCVSEAVAGLLQVCDLGVVCR